VGHIPILFEIGKMKVNFIAQPYSFNIIRRKMRTDSGHIYVYFISIPNHGNLIIALLAQLPNQRTIGRRDVGDFEALAGKFEDHVTALESAEIEPELPPTIDVVPEARQELFGWAVREGVTNVVRHSGAKRCWITLTPSSVAVEDDGTGPGGTAVEGAEHGLDGLRERASAVGGTVTVGRSPQGGFALRVTVA